MAKGAAFFDLDRTLIKGNSGLLFAIYEKKSGRITWPQLAQCMFWMVLYHLNLLDLDRAYRVTTKLYKGMPEKEIKGITHDFFFSKVNPLYLREAKQAVLDHKEAGHPLIILSNSSGYQARLAAEKWDFDVAIANEFHTDENENLTGTVASPLCYGPGKLVRAEQWAQENGVDLKESYFYTDSFSDKELLDEVGYPIVVNPDPKLRSYAKSKGWDTRWWSETLG